MMDCPQMRTVMSIDDESFDQLLYKRIIERSGLVQNFITFQMAEDALSYLRSEECEEIDVIFLDINMPGMNGFEFLERVASEFGTAFPAIIVVMLTTSLDPEDESRARSFEMVKGFLNKPLTVDELQMIVGLVHHEKTVSK